MPIDIVTGADARANVAGQPVNVMLYGPPGTEKTSDAVRLFVEGGRGRCFTIPCEDNALKAIASRGWEIPDHPKQTVKSWAAMTESIAWLYNYRQHYTGLVLDSFSVFTNYLYKEAEDVHKGERNKFAIPMAVRTCLLQLREWLRLLGMHVIITAHPQPPAVQDGVFYTGGFAMSPKTLIDTFFGQIDTVMRIGHVQTVPGQPPKRVYFTGGTEWPAELPAMSQPPDWRFWRTKNREGCNLAIVEADLGKFLRARQPPYAGL